MHNESTLTASQKLSKRVTKLSMRIMLLLCFFFTPHLIMFILRVAIQSGLNAYEKSILEFIFATGLCEFISECYFVLNDKRESKKIYG